MGDKMTHMLLIDAESMTVISKIDSNKVGNIEKAYINRDISDSESINLVMFNSDEKLFFYNFDKGEEFDITYTGKKAGLINICSKTMDNTLKQNGVFYKLDLDLKRLSAYDLYDFSRSFEYMFPKNVGELSCYTVNANNDTLFMVENGRHI